LPEAAPPGPLLAQNTPLRFVFFDSTVFKKSIGDETEKTEKLIVKYNSSE